MPVSNYNTGFPNGVTIRNVPILDLQNGNGNVFHVNSVTGSDSNKGTFNFPLKTLLKALTLVKPDQGDKIFINAGHEETISDATTYNINVSGIQIFGLGTGTNRPLFTYTGLSSTVLQITADNVYFGNVRCAPDLADLDRFININANNTIVENIECDGEDIAVALIDHAGDNNKIINCNFKVFDSGSSCNEAIHVIGDSDNIQILDCNCTGGYSRGNIKFDNVNVTNFFADGGHYTNFSSQGHLLFSNASASSTGLFGKNISYFVSNPVKLPIYSENNAKIGFDNQGEVISFSVVVPVSKIISSSAYIFKVESGSYYLEDAAWETDGTGLGGATNVELKKDDKLYGASVFFEEAVTNLPVYTSVALEDASVVSTKVGLGTDCKIQINSSGAALTGGDSRITFKFRSLESGSNISKNLSF